MTSLSLLEYTNLLLSKRIIEIFIWLYLFSPISSVRKFPQLLPAVFQGHPSDFALCMSHFSPGAQALCWSAGYFIKNTVPLLA